MTLLSIILFSLTTGAAMGLLFGIRHGPIAVIVIFSSVTIICWLLLRAVECIRIKSVEKLAKTFPRPPPEQTFRRFKIVALMSILLVPVIVIGIVSINNSIDRTIIMPIVIVEVIVTISFWGAYMRLRRAKVGDETTVLLQAPRSFSPLFVVVVMPLVLLSFLIVSHFFGMTTGGITALIIYVLYRVYIDLVKRPRKNKGDGAEKKRDSQHPDKKPPK